VIPTVDLSGGFTAAGKPQAAALLSVRNLGVEFRQAGKVVVAVTGATFDIAKGETMALVGESGSGKSVTALSVMRLLPPSAVHPAGEILFKGKDILKASERELRAIRGDDIGIVFQEPMTSLNPLHTIERQVGETLKVHRGMGDKAARARVLELLDQVGIRDAAQRLNAYPHQLSGGQRQRVMPMGDQRCSNCAQFTAPNLCAILTKRVVPTGWCNAWVVKPN
jgi:microcin C transport system ATP-binding protein